MKWYKRRLRLLESQQELLIVTQFSALALLLCRWALCIRIWNVNIHILKYFKIKLAVIIHLTCWEFEQHSVGIIEPFILHVKMINDGIPVIVQDLLKSEKYGSWRLLFKIVFIWSLQVRNPMGSKENGGHIVITESWSRCILKRMGFKKRCQANFSCQLSKSHNDQHEKLLQIDCSSIVLQFVHF